MTDNVEYAPLAVPLKRRPRKRLSHDELDPIVRALINERVRRELTGRDVTRAIGGSQSDISRWERGLSEPSLRRLRQWAASLGYDLTLVQRTSPGASQ